MTISADAVLSGYQAFVTKEDLLVHERITFTIKEEGTCCILQHFDPRLAANDTWTAVTIPQDSPCKVAFDTLDLNLDFVEVCARRKFSEAGPTTTYRFVFEREYNERSSTELVLPYFRARVEETVEKKYGKGGVQTELRDVLYPFELEM